MTRSDDFSAPTKRLLAERAAYRCSNPDCRKVTIGASFADTTKVLKPGVASHICAARKGGPRFKENQSSEERKSASNGIWLCASCSLLIDKNQGIDFPEGILRSWKEQHELATFVELSNGQIEVGPTAWCEEFSGKWKLFAKNPTMSPFLDCVIRGYKVENCNEMFADVEVVFGTLPPRQTIDETVEYHVLQSDFFGHPIIEIEYTDANGSHWCRDRFGRLQSQAFRRPFD
jgi:hypothetical protein